MLKYFFIFISKFTLKFYQLKILVIGLFFFFPMWIMYLLCVCVCILYYILKHTPSSNTYFTSPHLLGCKTGIYFLLLSSLILQRVKVPDWIWLRWTCLLTKSPVCTYQFFTWTKFVVVGFGALLMDAVTSFVMIG